MSEVTTLNVKQSAMAFGTIFLAIHLAWVLIVALGFGQPVSDWLSLTHFLKDFPEIASFDFITAIVLLVRAYIAGLIFGWLLAMCWNHCKFFGEH